MQYAFAAHVYRSATMYISKPLWNEMMTL